MAVVGMPFVGRQGLPEDDDRPTQLTELDELDPPDELRSGQRVDEPGRREHRADTVRQLPGLVRAEPHARVTGPGEVDVGALPPLRTLLRLGGVDQGRQRLRVTAALDDSSQEVGRGVHPVHRSRTEPPELH